MARFLFWWVAVLIGLAYMCFSTLQELPDGKLHFHFLDVGQGDGYLMVMPSGTRVVVDAGPGSNIIAPLRDALGWMNDDIDIVILTHFDRDHAEGMLAIMQSFHVKKLIITGVEQKSELQQMIMARVVADRVPVAIAYADTDFVLDESVKMDMIWPPKSLAGKYFKKANEAGIVYRLLVGDNESRRCVLLAMADTGFPTEEALMRVDSRGLDCDVLKVGHHGSKYSSGLEFLRAVSPVMSVISVGAKNGYKHPTKEVLDRLAAVDTEIFRTDQMGTVEMVVNVESREVEEVKRAK